MALSRVKTWISGDVLTASDLNAEFNNILNNPVSLISPLTAAISLAGFALTLDAASASTLQSTASQFLQLTPGAKAGTPSTTGGIVNLVASTYTDNNTAGSGTATAFDATAIQKPTLAATNANVVTTTASTVHILSQPAAGTNETLTTAAALRVSGTAASSGTNTAAIYVDVAPSGATNNYSLWDKVGPARFDGNVVGIGMPHVMELRLTLTTSLPVTTADVTAAGTIYLTPYSGSHISLYDSTSTQWITYSTAEISLALTATSGKPYDVWCYANAGVPTLETLVWTNDTTRATALTKQNGVYVKTGDATRRYVGSFYASGANTTEDSIAKRYLWNYYNRVNRVMRVIDATGSWTYTTDTWRQARAQATNQLDCIRGVDEDIVFVQVVSAAANTGASVSVGNAIGLDSTTTPVAGSVFGCAQTGAGANANNSLSATYNDLPGVGRHFFAWLERSAASGTTTWLGSATYQISGITGIVRS